jgi:hypothetical protein
MHAADRPAMTSEPRPDRPSAHAAAPVPAAAEILRLQASAGNAAVARTLARRCACGGRLEPGEGECAECKQGRLARAGNVLQRDALQAGDTAPQDAVDRRAGGRARSSWIYGRQCDPYTDRAEADRQLYRLRWEVPLLVESVVQGPAAADAAAAWRRYLSGSGGTLTHDGIANPSDRVAADFARDDRHRPAEDPILTWVGNQSRLRELVLPRLAGTSSVTLTLDELRVPDSMRWANPYYDSDYSTVEANLAGGIGESDFGTDSRRIDGSVTFEKTVDGSNRLWCSVRPRAEFIWTVRDGIDFCPGNSGAWHQEWLTIPMSRLEATGRVRDVGLLVRFRRVRYDTPQSFPNPDFQTAEAQ